MLNILNFPLSLKKESQTKQDSLAKEATEELENLAAGVCSVFGFIQDMTKCSALFFFSPMKKYIEI